MNQINVNQNSNNRTSGGIGFCGMLTILFIAFKLLGIITWSWLWVLSPLWISAVLAIAIVVIVAIISETGNN